MDNGQHKDLSSYVRAVWRRGQTLHVTAGMLALTLWAAPPVEAAMQVLGHSTAKVNLKHYTGILTKLQRAAANSLPSIG